MLRRRIIGRVISRVIIAAPLGVVLALAAVVLPTVRPGPGRPPATVSEQVALAAPDQPVGPGWTAAAKRPANLVGVQWEGDRGARFTVEAREPSGHWSPAATLGTPDFGPDPGSLEARRAAGRGNVSEPVWIGDASEVRVRLVGGAGVHHVVLHSVLAPKTKPAEGVAAAFTPWPNVIFRYQWGADESLRLARCSAPQYDSKVSLAVVHHTDNANNYRPGDSAALVRAIYAYHTVSLGYCDIAYNFLVDRFGQVFEGRYGGVTNPVHGAHAIGFNTNTTGIAVIGNFQVAGIPAPALAALEATIAWKFSVSGVDPRYPLNYTTISGNDKFRAGTTISTWAVIGHRDTWFTDCPGQYLWSLLPTVRQDVVNRLWLTGPDVFPSWQPQAGVPKLLSVAAFGSVYPAGAEPWPGVPAYWPGWPIVRDVALRADGSGYTLDGWGGLHPFGGAPPVFDAPYWRGWDIARDLELLPGGGGYELDGWGGIHAFGGAPPLAPSAYWHGFDIARKLAVVPGGGGYVLDGWGGVHAAGGAPPVFGAPYWYGWDIARGLVAAPGGTGLYLLDGFGGLWPLAGAPAVGGAPYFGSDFARDLAMVPGTPGGYVLDLAGAIHPFGGAPGVAHVGTPVPWLARGLAAVP